MTTTIDALAGQRPVPIPLNFSKPFWDGAKRGVLMLQYCPVAKKYQFYPRPVSVYTGKRNLEWRQASGKGTIYTYTITHRAPAPFKDVPPYVVATVELEEKVRIISNVINCPVDQVRIGMPVRVTWTKIGDETMFPLFEPDR
ncbi:MAG: Zn-ribbon domain-containing OB-fold protein [Candidatus Rokubacteria bacterium]|nr:Zn-ribbon domain-containing OB-fold protein [Candidatus Rokubacteria bacterium]